MESSEFDLALLVSLAWIVLTSDRAPCGRASPRRASLGERIVGLSTRACTCNDVGCARTGVCEGSTRLRGRGEYDVAKGLGLMRSAVGVWLFVVDSCARSLRTTARGSLRPNANTNTSRVQLGAFECVLSSRVELFASPSPAPSARRCSPPPARYSLLGCSSALALRSWLFHSAASACAARLHPDRCVAAAEQCLRQELLCCQTN